MRVEAYMHKKARLRPMYKRRPDKGKGPCVRRLIPSPICKRRTIARPICKRRPVARPMCPVAGVPAPLIEDFVI